MAFSPAPHARSPGYWGSVARLHGAVLLFGVAGLFGKWLALPALVIVFGRVAFAALGLGLLLRLRPLPGPGVNGRDLRRLWACGAILALHWFTFFQSIQVSTVAVGLLSFSTAPVFVALLEPLWFRERFSRTALGCALVSILGVGLIVPRWDAGDALAQGVAWGVLSGASFAVLSLFNRGLVRVHAPVRVAFHQDLAAAVLLAPLVVWIAPVLTPQDLALLAVLGLACTALAHTLFIGALAVLTARTAALAGALEPLYGLLLAWLLLGEAPSLRTAAGGGLVLLAVIWATVHHDATARGSRHPGGGHSP